MTVGALSATGAALQKRGVRLKANVEDDGESAMNRATRQHHGRVPFAIDRTNDQEGSWPGAELISLGL